MILIVCLAVLCLLKGNWESLKSYYTRLNFSISYKTGYRLTQRKFCNCCSNTVDASVTLTEVSSRFLVEVSKHLQGCVFLNNLSRMNCMFLMLSVSPSVFLSLQMLHQKQLGLC